MNILSLDTAGDFLSIALQAGDDVYSLEIDAGRRHSELLISALESICALANIKANQLDLLACTKGPGSFTGIRIAFSALKGIALATDTKTIAIPSIDVMAFPHGNFSGLVLPVIDARQGRFFYALYKNGNRQTDFLDEKIESIFERLETFNNNYNKNNEHFLLTGPAANLFLSRLKETNISTENFNFYLYPNYRGGLAKPLLQFLQKTDKLDYNQLVEKFGDFIPLYIRKSDAEERDEIEAKRTG